MISIRLANERGYAEHGGWLKSRHSFSFARYYDPKFMGFSALRVINEDWIAPTGGFGTHPHQNMEILTYVLNGAVAHKDSMGNTKTITAGEFQIMSAGTGITHSEFNPSATEELHLYQIWIIPNEMNITPRYEQRAFDNQLGGTLILSPTAAEGSFKVYQDMSLWRYQLTHKHPISVNLDTRRNYWVQITKGSVVFNHSTYHAGDAIALRHESHLAVSTTDTAEFLLFDLPPV